MSIMPTAMMAQRYYNSPLSRFNIGTLENSASVRSMGMGGTGIAVRVNDQVYESNPASYSAIDTNCFVFDFGLDYGILKLSNGTDKYKSDDLSFHHLKLAFPLNKKIGMGMGIVPYSNSYYSVSSTNSSGSSVGHSGEGGLTKLFTGLSANFFKGLSTGVNLNVLYGEINRSNYHTFTDENVFDIQGKEYIYLRGLYFDLGVQYEQKLPNDYYATVGFNTTFGNKIKSVYNSYNNAYNEYTTNTILSISDSTDAVLPTQLDFGVAFGKKDKLLIALDYLSTMWKKEDIKGGKEYLTNSNSLRAGVEYVPDRSSYYNILKRMEYRAGVHLDNYYLNLNDNQLKGYGISIGLGMPMRRSYSRINLYADYTRKILPTDLYTYSENFFTFGVSLNLYERWFLRSRYN